MVLTEVFLEMLNANLPSPGQHPGAKHSFHVLPFQTRFVLVCRVMCVVFAERVLLFASPCYSNRSSGAHQSFGSEVWQLGPGGTQGALGTETQERLLRLSDQLGSLWQQCCQDDELSLQSV